MGGEPLVGDREFSGQYDSALGTRHFRFVNNNDTVTRVPLEKFSFKDIKIEYSHVGTLIYIKSNQDLDTKIGKLDRGWGRLTSALKGDFADGLSDHSISEYVAALEKNLGKNPL